MQTSAARLSERMLEEGQRVVEFYRALGPDELAHTLYADGAQWTVGQLLCHLVSAEQSMTRLVEGILGGGSGSPEDFDLDRYNERKVAALAGVAPEALLEQYWAARQASAALAAHLEPQQLQMQGRHPFLGMACVEDILKLMYRHNQVHLREVRRALAGAEPQDNPALEGGGA
ncbi:MAG: maleylpyruvate isomerase N-terminal domain-containing protein [Chloroflexota bacterium]